MDIVALIGTIIFWFVVILIPLVVVHELGHTLMAKLMKIRVVEFGIGLPPRTRFAKRFWGMLFSLNWLPIGGFARIYGDHDALDDATSIMRTNPAEAKELYQAGRLRELIENRDIETILADNGMQYDDEWKTFLTLANKKHLEDSERTFVSKKTEQLKTLIDWELEAKKNSKSAFFNRGFFPQFLVLIGGVLFNYIFAWILIFLLMNFGSIDRIYVQNSDLPQLSDNVTVVNSSLLPRVRVANDTPAARAGLDNRDTLITIGGQTLNQIETFESLVEYVQASKGNPIEIEYYNDGNTNEKKVIQVTPEFQNESKRYLIGLTLFTNEQYKAKDFVSSFAATTTEVNNNISQIWNGLISVLKALLPTTQDKTALESVGGPIAIAGLGSATYNLLGVSGVVYIIAIISLSLAVFNLLPLPVLDGGRILISAINKITRTRNRRIEAILINVTMIALLILFIFIAFRDASFVRNLI